MISNRTVGLVLGLVLGIVWMWLGFGPALIVAALGLAGWLIGAVVSSVTAGNLDLTEFWSDLRGRQ